MKTNHVYRKAGGWALAAAAGALMLVLPGSRPAEGGSNYYNANICGWTPEAIQTPAILGNYLQNGLKNTHASKTIYANCPIPQDREDMDNIVFRVRARDMDTGTIPIICTGVMRDSAGNVVNTTIDASGPFGTFTGFVTLKLEFPVVVNNGTNHHSYSVYCTLPPKAELYNIQVIPNAEYQN
jgi:hypothetical protein